ncbi:unnamed protein product [Rotaria sp. Silwood2]|nr:unnamed protein product [Rotaria sp. Silwood2]
MEDRFQFEDFDNPQLLATNNRDQEITIVAANDKIKRTKNEQQVIKENNLREPNQQKSVEPTHLDIISSENYLLTITLGPVNMLDAESYKVYKEGHNGLTRPLNDENYIVVKDSKKQHSDSPRYEE